MWPNWLSNRNKENILMGDGKTPQNLLDRLDALEETVDKLEKERKSILLEWDEMYERFRLLYARLSKRVKQLERAPEVEEDTVARVGEEEPGQLDSLTPRQKAVNDRILALRARGGGGVR